MSNARQYLIGGVAVLLVIIGLIFWYNNRIEAAEKRGAEAQQAQHDQALAEANEINRKLESLLIVRTEELAAALNQKNEQVVVTRDRVRTVVETIIQENPIYQQCEVDQAIIDEINQLRSLTRE